MRGFPTMMLHAGIASEYSTSRSATVCSEQLGVSIDPVGLVGNRPLWTSLQEKMATSS